MNKKILALIGLVVFLVALSISNIDSTAQRALPTPNIPDTAQNRQIMETINRAREIEREATLTFNFERFDQIFINDPRFPVSEGTLQTIRELTYDPSWETAGFLDYKLAYYTWTRDAILKKEALEAKAKTENRELTKEERQSLVDEFGRTAPARPPSEPQDNAPSIKFLSIEVNEDIATVKLDDGPRIVEYVLVLVNHQWYMAHMTILVIKA